MNSSLFYNYTIYNPIKNGEIMKGLVIINAYPRGEKFYKQGNRIAEELRALGIETDVLKNGEVHAWIEKDGNIQSDIASEYDFAVYLDKDKYLGKMLEKKGMRLFNPASAIEICDDKMLTYLALSGKNIPMIQSIPAPLCYTPNAKVDEEFLRRVAKNLGFPLVVKQSYGSFGAGVHLVHGMPELKNIAQKILREPHIFQQYIVYKNLT
jgi:ribosomal protein S6--L-glutamate ligase/gamma-F420-2:alpha-L-glutamate ligase